MDATISPRALDVLKRGFEVARLDPAVYAVRLRLIGTKTQTSFSDEPDAGDAVVHEGGLRLFLDSSIATHASVSIDVTPEHDTIVVRCDD